LSTFTSVNGPSIIEAGLPPTDDIQARTASEIFGSRTLSWLNISQQLDGEQATAFREYVQGRKALDKDTANQVGEIVKNWALRHGATHYAHWFFPLTGTPAEKHDALLSIRSTADGEIVPMEALPGSRLIQGEPDASSFPSGGLRATHTARGYTIWDPQTPLIIREEGGARTLIVTCAYVSYKGHALDLKTPLLRALSALDREGTRFVNLVRGTDGARTLKAVLGCEQEYFLVDDHHVAGRPDLIQANRTLLGLLPAKQQQLEDQYFGPIPARIQAYMADVEEELYRLGVPVKTRHNEVAPSQYEIAPIHEEVSVACDHNALMMDVLKRTALRHGLVCLLHEKPFAGINGSGKHNNWSMCTQDGLNLLDPGSNEDDHFLFAASLSAVLLALHQHAGVLRVTVASSGNDHRLGANEAPPPIISAYLGEAIHELAEALEKGEGLSLRAGQIQAITDRLSVTLDATDRNRTAPFAFTGNKFEFRAVGSTQNPAWPMTILNAAVADAMAQLSGRLEQKLASGGDRKSAVLELVREVLAETKQVRFEGNGYAPEWVEEAARRGLPIYQDTPAALGVLLSHEATGFLTRLGVLSEEELHSRYEIFAERYLKDLDIEAATLGRIATTQIVPALERQVGLTGEAVAHLSRASHERLARKLELLGDLTEKLLAGAEALEEARGTLFAGEVGAGLLSAREQVKPALTTLREACDASEATVSAELWPLPTYLDMLFPV